MKGTLIISLFVFGALFAQEKKMGTLYFEFDKYIIDANQVQVIEGFIRKIDTTQLESIQIYGYCDDRGDTDYNMKLSENRVNAVKSVLIANGFSKNKIVIIEGKGRVLLDADSGKFG